MSLGDSDGYLEVLQMNVSSDVSWSVGRELEKMASFCLHNVFILVLVCVFLNVILSVLAVVFTMVAVVSPGALP